MPIVAKTLLEPKLAEQVQTTQYTTPVIATIIDKFTATNVNTAARTISVNLVRAGDVPGSNNLIVNAKTLQSGEAYTFPELVGHILNTGDYISTLASVAASITIRVSGREVS
jgi:hypothetical protein